MSRLICPNCGRAFQATGASAECPRCHYRSGSAASYAPAPPAHASRAVAASTFSLTPPEPVPAASLPPPPSMVAQRTNGLAVAALVLGIIGIVLPILALLALPLGIVGKAQTRRANQPGGALAIAGIVIAVVSLLLWTLLVGALFAAFG